MLVYGDHSDRANPRALIERLAGHVYKRGCDTWALIEAGRLVQGVLDGQMEAEGADEWTALSEASAHLMVALASGETERALDALGGVARSVGAEEISLNVPEGYAFYAVYPELYARAARELPRPVQAIGIRSIGTSLSAVVAAATGGPPPLFLRAVGHPFRRELRLGPRLAERLGRNDEYAVVDEGPGLSGSSFLAVARELMSRGVPSSSIHLFPAHDRGPGREAAPQDLALWRQLPRHVRGFDELASELPRWCEDLTGPPVRPLEDIGAGAWRARVHGEAPAMAAQERRKYLLHSRHGKFLLKFAGLGNAGDDVFRRARIIADAGFAPPPLGLRNGFLVTRWLEARVAEPGSLEETVARYVAFRSRALPALSHAGASPELLLQMAIRNTSLALGDTAAAILERWRPRLDELTAHLVRVETDNRMHRWEWLELEDGQGLKADSAEHCRGHDLVGCQDPAWDLAGAAIELDLDEGGLVRRFRAHGGRGGAPELLSFLRPCYLAFQLGACTIADSIASMPEDSARLRAQASRYRDLLARELSAS